MAGERTLIQVGQVLDKYELLERVGQGGMAIVYRGIDRTLKRTVAVKILHKHLSDYQEARDRFEREAQAVAKLRHENILEIFDYSAKEGSESYIVTEFIDGQTLKQFVTDRPFAYPEVGAMVLLQVCRALAHAHAGGILHRDVKPENIMIRSDGVVKLMDFGISHMVDLERLTVTGQLLGSPAYMAPEHVEGRPLDFRTDVFAAGIVLYQMTVGKLPFEGKNPHEVLKRIAECRFVDPRQANPRIGNRLGRIILRAMAAQPGDRYPGVGEMVLALEAYLEESGLPKDKIPGELARYFKAPGPYELALKERLIDTLTRRGQQLLDDDNQSGALDAFDRVLTIDPENAKVLAILDRLNRRARMRTAAIAAGVIVILSGGGYLIHRKMAQPPPVPPELDLAIAHGSDTGTQVVHVEAPPDAAEIVAADAPLQVVAVADAQLAVLDADRHAAGLDGGTQFDPFYVDVRVSPAGGSFRIDGGPPQPISGNSFSITVLDHDPRVEIDNPHCQAQEITIDRSKRIREVTLQFSAAAVVPICKVPDVSVSVDNQPVSLDTGAPVSFEPNATSSLKHVVVRFTTDKQRDEQQVTVEAGESKEVTCALH